MTEPVASDAMSGFKSSIEPRFSSSRPRPPVENCTIMPGQWRLTPACTRSKRAGIRGRRARVVAHVNVHQGRARLERLVRIDLYHDVRGIPTLRRPPFCVRSGPGERIALRHLKGGGGSARERHAGERQPVVIVYPSGVGPDRM